MPKNRLMYLGVLIVVAAAVLLASKWLLSYILPMVLYIVFGVGVLLIVVGLVMEGKRKQDGVMDSPTKGDDFRNV